MEFDLDSSSSQVTPKQLAALRSWIDTFPFMNEEQGCKDGPLGRGVSTIIVCNLTDLSVKPLQGKEKRFQINWKRFR